MSLEIETVFRSRANSRGVVLAAFRGLAEQLRRYLVRRATDRALSRLSDEELRDIGLYRTSFGYEQIPDERRGLQRRK